MNRYISLFYAFWAVTSPLARLSTMWNGYPSNYGTSYAPYGKAMNFAQGWQLFNGVNTPLSRPNVVGNPSYIFDRRYNGSTELPDATNAGEINWQSNAFIRAMTNGTWTQGNCKDIIVYGYDTDDNPYDQLTIGRNGNITVRKSVIAGGKVMSGTTSDSLLVHSSTTKAVHAIAQNSISGLGQYPHTIFTPSSSGTVSLVNHQYNIINPPGSLSALTVNLPSSPANNDVMIVKYIHAVSTLTYSGGTVAGGISSPADGGMVVLTYDSGTAT